MTMVGIVTQLPFPTRQLFEEAEKPIEWFIQVPSIDLLTCQFVESIEQPFLMAAPAC